MEKIPRLSSDRREDLVAYLDGELDEEGSGEIERTLAQSPVARHEVEMLTRTFELLDVLPGSRATEEFTNRTLATVRMTDAAPSLSERRWFQQARRGLAVIAFFAALGAFAVVGFLATNAWVPDDSEMLVEDLLVIENLDVYREVGDVRFLRELQTRGYLLDDPEADSNP